MQSTDLQVIKDIPGYKVILKAVLKSQIQLLVEELADHTGEESIILTASVSDESLSQLGSESGKVFLEDHDDIKSQFLDFCLKHHHKREQQEKEISQQQEDPGGQVLMAQNTQRNELGPRPEFAATHVQNSTRQISPGNVHPISLTRVSPQTGAKGANVRHEPYSVASLKKSNSNFQSQKRLSKPSSSATLPTDPDNAQTDNQNQVTIKTEPIDNDENADMSGAGSDSPSLALRDDGSESSSSTIINESSDIKFSDMLPSGGLGLDSDLSNHAGQMDTSNDSVTADPKKVKVEAITESELDLETKVVEAGQMAQPDYGIMPNIQTGMGYDPSTSDGAQGSVGDQSSQEYKQDSDLHKTDTKSAKALTCQFCGKVFSCVYDLDIHKKHSHTGEKPYICESCGKLFLAKKSLVRHRITHTGEKPYSCKTCGTVFTVIDSLKRHLKIHAGEKPYSCETCGFSFARKNNLELHRRIHSGEKPYICDTCGKSFVAKIQLEKHKRTHTKEKPYSCVSCGKCFGRKDYLYSHNRVHSGEKPYICEICGKSFAGNSSFRYHSRVHTKDKPYTCETCGESFEWKGQLRSHHNEHKKLK